MSVTIASDPIPLETDTHGVIRVKGSRVTLESIVASFNQGVTPEEIVQQYPTLDLADVYAIVTYYLKHSRELDKYLYQERLEAQKVREEYEIRFGQRQLREQLLSRYKQKKE